MSAPPPRDLDGSNNPPPPPTNGVQAAADNLVGTMEPDNGFGLGRAPDHARPVTVDSTRDRPPSRQQAGGRGGGNAAFMAGAPAGQVIYPPRKGEMPVGGRVFSWPPRFLLLPFKKQTRWWR